MSLDFIRKILLTNLFGNTSVKYLWLISIVQITTHAQSFKSSRLAYWKLYGWLIECFLLMKVCTSNGSGHLGELHYIFCIWPLQKLPAKASKQMPVIRIKTFQTIWSWQNSIFMLRILWLYIPSSWDRLESQDYTARGAATYKSSFS